MSKLENFGAPETGSAILHPVLANRWRMIIGSETRSMLFTQQVVSVEFDMLNNNMTVEVEQPLPYAQELLKFIRDVGRYQQTFSVQLLTGDGQVAGEHRGFAKLTKHKLRLDYAVNDTAKHVLTFKTELAE